MIIPLTESGDQRSDKEEKIQEGQDKVIVIPETFVQLDPWNRGREAPNSGPLWPLQPKGV